MAFETTLELAQFVEKELGHDISTTASSQRADIFSQLDTSHKTILAGGGLLNFEPNGERVRSDVTFAFAKSANPKIIKLPACVNTATVTATNGSNAITFSADPNGGTSISGWHIRIADQDEVYRITSHVAGATTAVLDGDFVGANVTDGVYEAGKIQHTVGSSDILQLLSPLRVYGADSTSIIKVVDKDEMLDQFPLGDIEAGFPSMAAIILEQLGTVTLQMSSYVDETERVECDYIPYPTTLSESVDPIIPKHFRMVLAYLTLYHMMVRNDDDRAAAHLQMARDKFSELVQWNERMYAAGDPDYGRVVLNCGFAGSKNPKFTQIT